MIFSEGLQKAAKFLERMSAVLGAAGEPNAPIGRLVNTMNTITSNAYSRNLNIGSFQASRMVNVGLSSGLTVQGVVDTANLSDELGNSLGFTHAGTKGLTTYALAKRAALQSEGSNLIGNENLDTITTRKQRQMAGALTSDAAKMMYLSKMYQDDLKEDAINKDSKLSRKQKDILLNVSKARREGVPIVVDDYDEYVEALSARTGSHSDMIDARVNIAGTQLVSETIANDPHALEGMERTIIRDATKRAVEDSMDTFNAGDSKVSEGILRRLGKTEEQFMGVGETFMQTMRNNRGILDKGRNALYDPRNIKIRDELVEAFLAENFKNEKGVVDSKAVQKTLASMSGAEKDQLVTTISAAVNSYGEARGSNEEGGYAAMAQDSQRISSATSNMNATAGANIEIAKNAYEQTGTEDGQRTANVIDNGVGKEQRAYANNLSPGTSAAATGAVTAFFKGDKTADEIAEGLFTSQGEINERGGVLSASWKKGGSNIGLEIDRKTNEAIAAAARQQGIQSGQSSAFNAAAESAIRTIQATSYANEIEKSALSASEKAMLGNELRVNKNKRNIQSLQAVETTGSQQEINDAEWLYEMSNSEKIFGLSDYQQVEDRVLRGGVNNVMRNDPKFVKDLYAAKNESVELNKQIGWLRNRAVSSNGMWWGGKEYKFDPNMSDEQLVTLMRFMRDPDTIKNPEEFKFNLQDKDGNLIRTTAQAFKEDTNAKTENFKWFVQHMPEQADKAAEAQRELLSRGVTARFGSSAFNMQGGMITNTANPLGELQRRRRDKVVREDAVKQRMTPDEIKQEQDRRQKIQSKFNSVYYSGSNLDSLSDEELKENLKTISQSEGDLETGVYYDKMTKEELIKSVDRQLKNTTAGAVRQQNETINILKKARVGSNANNFLNTFNSYTDDKNEFTAYDVAATAMDSLHNWSSNVKDYDDYLKKMAGMQKDIDAKPEGKEKEDLIADRDAITKQFAHIAAGVTALRPDQTLSTLEKSEKQLNAQLANPNISADDKRKYSRDQMNVKARIAKLRKEQDDRKKLSIPEQERLKQEDLKVAKVAQTVVNQATPESITNELPDYISEDAKLSDDRLPTSIIEGTAETDSRAGVVETVKKQKEAREKGIELEEKKSKPFAGFQPPTFPQFNRPFQAQSNQNPFHVAQAGTDFRTVKDVGNAAVAGNETTDRTEYSRWRR